MKQCWIQYIGEKKNPRLQVNWSRNHSSLTRNGEGELGPDLLLARLRRNRRRRRCTLKRRTRLRGNHEAAGRRRTFAPHRRSLERRRRLLHRRGAAWSGQTRRRRRISLSDRDAAGGTGSPPIVILVHVGGGVTASRRSDRFKRGEKNILDGVMVVCRGRLKHRRGRFVQFTYIHSVVGMGEAGIHWKFNSVVHSITKTSLLGWVVTHCLCRERREGENVEYSTVCSLFKLKYSWSCLYWTYTLHRQG